MKFCPKLSVAMNCTDCHEPIEECINQRNWTEGVTITVMPTNNVNKKSIIRATKALLTGKCQLFNIHFQNLIKIHFTFRSKCSNTAKTGTYLSTYRCIQHLATIIHGLDNK